MSNIRPYKGTYPAYDDSVYVDESAVLVGDITIGEHSVFGHWLQQEVM